MDRGAGEKDEVLTFASTQDFPSCMQQVVYGISTVKTLSNFLAKINTVTDSCSADILKATTNEYSKLRKLRGDGMKRALSAWLALQESCHCLASAQAQLSMELSNGVVLPLNAMHKEGEVRRKELGHEERLMTAQMKSVTDSVSKSEKECLKGLAQMKESQQRKEAPKDGGGFFAKMKDKAKGALADSEDVLVQKTVSSVVSYEQEIKAANGRYFQYQLRDIPRLFAEMQKLEESRLDVLAYHFLLLHNILQAIVEPMQNSACHLVQCVHSLDTDSDIQEFIQMYASNVDYSTQDEFVYDLPLTVLELEQGVTEPTLSNPKSVFKKSLDETMLLQQTAFPQLAVPAIMSVLFAEVKKCGGIAAEGIFRISAKKEDVEEYVSYFDGTMPAQGEGMALMGWDQAKITEGVDNPHLPAAVLKQWMRELKEPLIPEQFYAEAVAAAQNVDQSLIKDQVVAIYDKLPAINRAVITELCSYCREVVAQVDVNRMTIPNLAIVFLPSFLRCLSHDLTEILGNSRFEQKFVSVLLQHMCGGTDAGGKEGKEEDDRADYNDESDSD